MGRNRHPRINKVQSDTGQTAMQASGEICKMRQAMEKSSAEMTSCDVALTVDYMRGC
jgi:hypothetical protein